jgi:hypothetical protein
VSKSRTCLSRRANPAEIGSTRKSCRDRFDRRLGGEHEHDYAGTNRLSLATIADLDPPASDAADRIRPVRPPSRAGRDVCRGPCYDHPTCKTGERRSIVLMTIDWGAAATLVAGSATTIAGVFAKARIDRQHLVAQRATDVEGDALLQLQERLGTLPDAYYGILNHAEEIVQDPKVEEGQFDEEDVYLFVYEATARRREVELLATRIADDHLRQQVVNVIALVGRPQLSRSQPRAWRCCGERLRRIPFH